MGTEQIRAENKKNFLKRVKAIEGSVYKQQFSWGNRKAYCSLIETRYLFIVSFNQDTKTWQCTCQLIFYWTKSVCFREETKFILAKAQIVKLLDNTKSKFNQPK